MQENIGEAVGKADAAVALLVALIEHLITRNALSNDDAVTVISGALHAVSTTPETSDAERQSAASTLSPLLEHYRQRRIH